MHVEQLLSDNRNAAIVQHDELISAIRSISKNVGHIAGRLETIEKNMLEINKKSAYQDDELKKVKCEISELSNTVNEEKNKNTVNMRNLDKKIETIEVALLELHVPIISRSITEPGITKDSSYLERVDTNKSQNENENTTMIRNLELG